MKKRRRTNYLAKCKAFSPAKAEGFCEFVRTTVLHTRGFYLRFSMNFGEHQRRVERSNPRKQPVETRQILGTEKRTPRESSRRQWPPNRMFFVRMRTVLQGQKKNVWSTLCYIEHVKRFSYAWSDCRSFFNDYSFEKSQPTRTAKRWLQSYHNWIIRPCTRNVDVAA